MRSEIVYALQRQGTLVSPTQRIAARNRAVDAKKKRREDTSRKVLVGAVLLANP